MPVAVQDIPAGRALAGVGEGRGEGVDEELVSMIGGRIKKDELIQDAIKRHLLNDLQVHDFAFYPGNTAARPFYVQQYIHGNAPSGEFSGYDPSKHAIGLTYIITINEIPTPRAEAANFLWIDKSDVPEAGAYNQGLVMREAFVFIAKNL